MDYIKYAILAGLAVVSYMLLLAWQEDYPPVAPASPSEQLSAIPPAGDLPVAVPTQTDVADIPVVSTPGVSAIAESGNSNTNTLITVKTDVLNVTIGPCRWGYCLCITAPARNTT